MYIPVNAVMLLKIDGLNFDGLAGRHDNTQAGNGKFTCKVSTVSNKVATYVYDNIVVKYCYKCCLPS